MSTDDIRKMVSEEENASKIEGTSSRVSSLQAWYHRGKLI